MSTTYRDGSLEDGREAKSPGSGFSLIELAIIMVILSIIIATVLPGVLRRMESRIFRQSKESVAAAREEIVGFVLDNCRLPNDLDELSFSRDRGLDLVRYEPEAVLLGLSLADFPNSSTMEVTMTDGSGSWQDLACVVVGDGENRAPDLDLAARPILVPPYGQGSDDILDFLSIAYLKDVAGEICGGTPPPPSGPATHEIFEDLDDWNTGTTPDNFLLTEEDGQTQTVGFVSIREETTIHMQGNGTLRDIWGFSASDIWAVGDEGLVMYYNGAVWQQMNAGISQFLYGVWGTASNNLYAVAMADRNENEGTIYHFDGAAWSDMLAGPSDWMRFRDVYGTALDDIWAVSDQDGVTLYDGSWNAPVSPVNLDVRSVWASPAGHFYLTANPDRSSRPGQVWSLNGATGIWSDMGAGSPSHLNSIWGVDDSDIYAVGLDGEIIHYDGTGWLSMDSDTSRDLLHVYGFTPEWLFALADHNDLLLHFNGDRWCDIDSGSQESMRAIWGANRSDIWAVGGNDRNSHAEIVHLTGLGGLTLMYNRISDIRGAWETDTTLGYDVQTKHAWRPDLAYGMAGINFRWHESSVPDTYEGYGVSFMYYSECNDCGDDYDMLESTLKPRGTGMPTLSDTHLILVWKQQLNPVTGRTERHWLAYDIIDPGDDILRRDYPDPGRFYSYSTMHLRVRESLVGPDKVTTLQVFYATPVGEGVGDDTATNTHRIPYGHSQDDTANIHFPPDPVSTWDADNDYFTLVEWSSSHLNSDQSGAIALDALDSSILKLTEFGSPDTFDNRPELALHGLGNILSLDEGNAHERDRTILFDDFAIAYE